MCEERWFSKLSPRKFKSNFFHFCVWFSFFQSSLLLWEESSIETRINIRRLVLFLYSWSDVKLQILYPNKFINYREIRPDDGTINCTFPYWLDMIMIKIEGWEGAADRTLQTENLYVSDSADLKISDHPGHQCLH